MTVVFDKEAFTGIPGGLCRYSGSAGTGLCIELAAGDTLSVSADQVRRLCQDLTSQHRLFEECLGYTPPRGIVKRLGELRHAFSPGAWRGRRSAADQRVSARLMGWLHEHGAAEFGRALSAAQALNLQAVLCGEGLLAIGQNGPGDFAYLDPCAAVEALRGCSLIYEEGRRFAAVQLVGIERDGEGAHVALSLQNLGRPGFGRDFPEQFSVGSACSELSISLGTLSTYGGLWSLITGPGSVACIVERAARVRDRRELLKVVRAVQGYDRLDHAY